MIALGEIAEIPRSKPNFMVQNSEVKEDFRITSFPTLSRCTLVASASTRRVCSVIREVTRGVLRGSKMSKKRGVVRGDYFRTTTV